ncbi:CoA transferase [Thermanaerosceptrum fracticalcis]
MDGLRLLELTRVLEELFNSMMLADMGAEVIIKIKHLFREVIACS